MSVGAEDSAPSQKMHQEWTPVRDAKCKEFMRKMKDFRCQWGRRTARNRKKMHQEWAPVWDAKCKEFIRKMKDFRCQWGRRTASNHRKCTKSGPQYGVQNVRNS